MKLMETLNQCINAGHEMTKAIAIAQFNDDSPEARKITRRWRIGEAADLVGVSSQAIRDAEKAGRLPHPDMEIRGRVEQRVGYTIEQINHMRDVFGTRLRRAEDVFPPVIGVAAHKGGVYKTSVSVHLAQDLALKGLRVLLVEGNDPRGNSLNVSRMGTRSSYSCRRHSPAFLSWGKGRCHLCNKAHLLARA